jgi:hypothetical protein
VTAWYGHRPQATGAVGFEQDVPAHRHQVASHG